MELEATLDTTIGNTNPEPVTSAFVLSPYDCIVEIPEQPVVPTSSIPEILWVGY